MTSTRTGRAAIRSIVSMGWDGGDVKFSALNPLFGVCEVLHVAGAEVPAEAEFQSSPLHIPNGDLSQVEDEWPHAEFAQMLADGEIAKADLAYWVRVLNRFLDTFVRGTDHDY